MAYVDPKEVMARNEQYTFLFQNVGSKAVTISAEGGKERILPLGLIALDVSNPTIGSYDELVTFTNPYVGKTVQEVANLISEKLNAAHWYQVGKFAFREANTGAPESTASSQFKKYAMWAAVGVAAIAIGFGFVQGFARGAGAAAVGAT